LNVHGRAIDCAAGCEDGQMTKKTLTIQQYKSAARRPAYQGATLKGLGLNKIGRTRVIIDTPASRGMVASVAHMVRIVDDKK
jgi:large subunit ribosomal protein L30